MEISFGKPADIVPWMRLVKKVSPEFPGLETGESILEHEKTVLGFMNKNGALCVKSGGSIVGVLLFSRARNKLCFLAVDPEFRRQGAGTILVKRALDELDRSRDITVSTFRADDEKGAAPRALYFSFGFTEGELTEEFGYPNQVLVLRPPRA